MASPRVPLHFGSGGDRSLTLHVTRRRAPRDVLIVQDKSAQTGHDGDAHLTLRLPIAYLLFRMQKLRARAPDSRENRPNEVNLGQIMDRTTTPPSIGVTPRPTATAIAIAAIAVLIVSYAVNAMDRTLFPLMLTDVRREYGFALPQGGLLSTIFTLGMTLAGIPTGDLMSRFSRKTVIQVGILIYSAATVITAIASGFTDMLIYRTITGVGEAMQLTALLAVFSSYFSRNRAVGVGLLNYAYAGGAAIGPWLGAKLLVEYSTWRAPMIIFGVIGLAMMILIAAVVQPQLSEAKGEQNAG